MALTAFPLSWPDGWRRTPSAQRTRGRFNRKEREYYGTAQPGQVQSSWMRSKEMTVAGAMERLLTQLQMMGIDRDDVVISTNLPVRLDGLPKSNAAEPRDPGVAVYWRNSGEPMKCMAVDRYDRTADNLAAVAATLEAMRAIERHGGAEILDRAFRGFAALPEKASQPWREVLGLNSDPVTEEAIEQRFRELVRQHHPDVGGDREKFELVVRAREDAKREVTA